MSNITESSRMRVVTKGLDEKGRFYCELDGGFTYTYCRGKWSRPSGVHTDPENVFLRNESVPKEVLREHNIHLNSQED